jgi:hypothetical protein
MVQRLFHATANRRVAVARGARRESAAELDS